MKQAKPIEASPTLTFDLPVLAPRQGRACEREQQPGRIPRLARLLALAIRFEKLVRDGTVRDYAELARLGHVSRARITQIANLTVLAPDIQEEILFLPLTKTGHDPITIAQVQPIALTHSWTGQRRLWRRLRTGVRKQRDAATGKNERFRRQKSPPARDSKTEPSSEQQQMP